jgi:hypothetical protein
VSLTNGVQGSIEIRLPGCAQRLMTLGKGSHFGDLAIVSKEQLIRYDVLASQVAVCVSFTFEDVERAAKEVNFPLAQMQARAIYRDSLLIRCLRISKNVFELRKAAAKSSESSSSGTSETEQQIQECQAELLRISSRLFHAGSSRRLPTLPRTDETILHRIGDFFP